MKGIVLAGGTGSRLFPATNVISKQMLAVYDKPMIYYPLSTLMLAGIKDIQVISSPDHIALFEKLLGRGERFGLNISYAVQQRPVGIAHAFILSEEYIGSEPCALILGDNIFFGGALRSHLEASVQIEKGAQIFAHPVNDPEQYGVVELNSESNVISIEEKPRNPKSKLAVTGLYFYDNQVVEICKSINPSTRGELEITDVNRVYIEKGEMKVAVLGRGIAWLDTGTPDGLMDAAQFVKVLQDRQGVLIASPEEISWRNGWISTTELAELSSQLKGTAYGEYLRGLAIKGDR